MKNVSLKRMLAAVALMLAAVLNCMAQDGKAKLFTENGKYGVKVDSKVIIPAVLPIKENIRYALASEIFPETEFPELKKLVLSVKGNTEAEEYWKYGLFNDKGKEILACEYDNIWPLSAEYFEIEKGGMLGVFSITDRKVIVPCKYDDIKVFSNGYICAWLKDNSFYFNGKGNRISKEKFRDNVPLNDLGITHIDIMESLMKWYTIGVLLFEKNNKIGLNDIKGKVVVPAEYDVIYPPSDHSLFMLRMVKNGKTGYLDLEEHLDGEKVKVAIPAKYDEGSDFEYGIATVKLNGKTLYLTTEGKEVTKETAESIQSLFREFLFREESETDLPAPEKEKPVAAKDPGADYVMRFDSIRIKTGASPSLLSFVLRM